MPSTQACTCLTTHAATAAAAAQSPALTDRTCVAAPVARAVCLSANQRDGGQGYQPCLFTLLMRCCATTGTKGLPNGTPTSTETPHTRSSDTHHHESSSIHCAVLAAGEKATVCTATV